MNSGFMWRAEYSQKMKNATTPPIRIAFGLAFSHATRSRIRLLRSEVAPMSLFAVIQQLSDDLAMLEKGGVIAYVGLVPFAAKRHFDDGLQPSRPRGQHDDAVGHHQRLVDAVG